MTLLHSFLFASVLLLASASGSANTNTATSAGEATDTEVTSNVVRETLTLAIREGISFPDFSSEPNQEVIVRIRFQVDENNLINLLDVTGNDRRVVAYVEQNLQGKVAGEQPILPGVTFVSTLRFIR